MLGPFNSLHEHFNTDKTYLLYMKITYISLIHGVGIRVCITIGPSIWDEAIFQFGWEGGGVERTGTGFPLMLNWNKEIVFFLKFELTIFNNQGINIRVFLEFLAVFIKVLLYFLLADPDIFHLERWKNGYQNTLSQSRASLGFSRNSLSNRFGERWAPILKQSL